MQRDVSKLTALVRHLFEYDKDSGVLIRRVTSGSARKGTKAGTLTQYGYIQVRVDGRFYLAHRLIWLHVHGVWPDQCLDHVNGVTNDNRYINLRTATYSENGQNKVVQTNNRLGLMGVTYDKDRKSYRAHIRINNKQIFLGRYPTGQEAHEAYLKAKAKIHPFQPTLRKAQE